MNFAKGTISKGLNRDDKMTNVMTITMPSDVRKKLAEMAKKERRSESAMVHHLIEKHKSHRQKRNYLDTMTREEILNLADQLLDEVEG